MTVKVTWTGFKPWYGFFRFFRMWDGWQWSAGPINVLYYKDAK